ncbi:uncharacterized protein LOC110461777 [Mizuhopecten yessoensis]|uniref:uncharacterized protein LOC110461777 n=1 Tax=Mizuhopecten yessoensis TaxID=6573 RepID=UPI000B45774A|nr:uncharacterized protein LOC110461777 [Mizuhopecten yessoensis]
MDNTNQLLALMNQCGSDRQKFIVEEQSKLQIARHFCRMLQKTKYRRNIFNMTLNFDDTIEKAMNSITTLGVVEVSPSLSLPSLDALTSIERLIGTLKTIPLESSFADGTASDVIDETEKVLPSQETQRVDLWNVSLSPVKSVLCNSRGGSNQIWLTGGVFINGEGLLITDYYENRILLFDDHYDYVRQFGVVGKPSHISHGFTADEVLISLCSSRTILRCTLKGGVFTLNSRISTQFRTWGTSVLGDNILAGSTDAVQIILTDGTLVKSLNTSGGTAYVTVSPRGYFYHTDDNAIVCRSHHGKEKFRQNCQGLRGPCGIDVDQDSNVYVCGGLSGNVHLVSADGTKERELLPDLSGIRRPCAVLVHPTRLEFIVTSSMENVAFTVYKFCAE